MFSAWKLLAFATVCVGLSENVQINNKKFPKDFSFGASTAAFQIEGAWNIDGKSESIWDNFTHNDPSVVVDRSNADITCDSYDKYKEDVALLKDLEVNFYRFSIAWTRILPTGLPDKVNEAGVEYYKNLITELKTNKIEPMVTLYHGDLPQSLQDQGGVMNPLFSKWFADYARVCFERFGDDVQYWLTINEPYVSCTMGLYPPNFVDGLDTYVCAMKFLKAHAAAWHVYTKEFRATQKGKVAIVLNGDWMEPETNSTADIEAADRRMQFIWGMFASPLYKGDWPEIMKTRIAMRSRLEGFNQSRLPELAPSAKIFLQGTNDFFAVNSYTSSIVRAIEEPEISAPNSTNDIGVYAYQPKEWIDAPLSWMKYTPWGMQKLLRWIKNEYSNPEIIITENGWADGTGQLDDSVRENYIRVNPLFEVQIQVGFYNRKNIKIR